MFKRIILSSGIIVCLCYYTGFFNVLLSASTLPFNKYLFLPVLLFPGFLFFKVFIKKLPFYKHYFNPEESVLQSPHNSRFCLSFFKLFLNKKSTGYFPCSSAGKAVLNSSYAKTFSDGFAAGKALHDLLGRDPISVANAKVADLLHNKSILITGAAGSIGSGIARQIAALKPALLIICDQSETGLYELEYELQQQFNPGNTLKVFITNITNHTAITEVFVNWKPDIVFHAAAYKHVPMMELHPCEAIYNNVYGTKVLADLAELFEVERFILISTDKAVNPASIMGASKRIAEMYCNALQAKEETPEPNNLLTYLQGGKKTKFITTRFGNVLHSNGSVVPRFRQQIANGGPVTVTHPETSRYFMTIEEACSLVLEAVTMGNGGEIFMFDMGKPVNILELAQKMIRQAGHKPNETMEIQFTGLRPGEKLTEDLLTEKEETLPTHHPKIRIAKVAAHQFKDVKNSFAQLFMLAEERLAPELIKQIKRMVPEFTGTSTNLQHTSSQATIKTKVISFKSA